MMAVSCSVDDASGVIHCCQWRKTEGSDHGLFIPWLGQLVSVYGKMSEYRGDRQIRVFSIGKAARTSPKYLYQF